MLLSPVGPLPHPRGRCDGRPVAHRTASGGDLLIVDPTGIRRTSRRLGFDIAWTELDRIEFAAVELRPSYDAALARRRGTGFYRPNPANVMQTRALRFYPREPADFAERHPTVDASQASAPTQRFVGARFGATLAGRADALNPIGPVVAHFAGPRFGGVVDDRRLASDQDVNPPAAIERPGSYQ